MRAKRRGLFGILFALALAIGLLPGMALTAYAVDAAPKLTIGTTSVNVTEAASGAGWSYAPATDTTPATLTLNGVTITEALNDSAIHFQEASQLNIVLPSENAVGGGKISYGIKRLALLPFQETGALNALVREVAFLPLRV